MTHLVLPFHRMDPRSEKPAPKRSAARQPRRKKEKEEAESKELFAFYEQSLF